MAASTYTGQTLPKKGVAYFKAIEKVKKALSTSLKCLNMDNADSAMEEIRKALEGMAPYIPNR